jgi:hypothetical protein
MLRTFIWGLPHQYQARAPAGTTIALETPGIGAWTLTRTATGWSLDEGQADAPAVGLQISGEAAWRLLTGARYDARQVQLSGDPAPAGPLLRVPASSSKATTALTMDDYARSSAGQRLLDAALVPRVHTGGYAVPATPIRLPSGSVKWPTTRPVGARSGPIRRLPPRLSAFCRAASTSGTPT